MSGFTTGGRYGNRQVFELTSTKGAHWHRFCAQDGCLGSAPSAIAEAHLEPAGFTVAHDGGAYTALDGLASPTAAPMSSTPLSAAAHSPTAMPADIRSSAAAVDVPRHRHTTTEELDGAAASIAA